MAAEPTTRFHREAFEQALLDRDADALAAFYCEDAELTQIDRRHPPANPGVLRGREAIRAHLADVLAGEVEHRIERIVESHAALAYSLLCTYPDGLRVRYHAMAEVRDGLVHRETGVSAWDEAPTATGHALLTVRKLRPGTYGDWRRAWYDAERDGTDGIADRAYILRSVDDPDEVIAFGFFDDTDLPALRQDPDMRERAQERAARMRPFIASVGADGLYEVVEQLERSTLEPPAS